MERARQTIKEALGGTAAPAVLCSFGKDSVLLLHLAREVRPDIPAVWFRPQDERFAKLMIHDLDLEVWSWGPADVYVVPNGEGLSLVREQAFGPQRLPVLLDVEEGETCVADVFPERTPTLFPHFDCLLIGYKDSDCHASLGGSGFCPSDGWELGKARVYAPLRHMTDAEVWGAIRALGVPYDRERYDEGGRDPDTVSACTRCLQSGEGEVFCRKEGRDIPRVVWDRDVSLSAFRQRFGFKEAA